MSMARSNFSEEWSFFILNTVVDSRSIRVDRKLGHLSIKNLVEALKNHLIMPVKAPIDYQ